MPLHVKPIGCRQIYKIEHNVDCSIERFKAILVAKCYNKIYQLDYFDTYSPMARPTTIRLVVALTSINN